MPTPEEAARQRIDAALRAAGWAVQDRDAVNLWAAPGVAVREFSLKPGYGEADYLLYADGQAVGAVEAKKEGATLTGVEAQSAKYGDGLPTKVPAPVRPLPFLYESTGIETRFTNRLDPDPRSRPVFSFHRPETALRWAASANGSHPGAVLTPAIAEPSSAYDRLPRTLRGRLQSMPPIPETGLWPAQLVAVRNLERSLRDNKPRALIQMATGSGKTFTAITAIYRLIKFAGAERVLFLVDRANLGPPVAEQHRIVAEVERRLSVVDELEATFAANLKRADRLRQVILRRAFAGRLVPQDPNDEPASLLLERIRAERWMAPSANPGRHGRKRSQAAVTVPLPGLADAG